MRKKLTWSVILTLAMALSLGLAHSYAGAAAQPEVIVIGPSSVNVDNGGTIVLRGAYIKGSAANVKLGIKVGVDTGDDKEKPEEEKPHDGEEQAEEKEGPDDKKDEDKGKGKISIEILETTRHGNVVATEVRVRSSAPTTATLKVAVIATGSKKGSKELIAQKDITVTVSGDKAK